MKKNRGAALLETVISLGILAIGTAAVVSLVAQVQQAGTKSAYHAASLDLFAAFSAQVRAASCDVSPLSTGMGIIAATTDDGIEPGGPYTGTPVLAASAITLVGDFFGARAIAGAPPMRLTYEVQQGPITPDAPPLLELDVTIREITYDAGRDALAMGPWVKNFRLTKVCNLRTDEVTGCPGGNPPCGRGEFY